MDNTRQILKILPKACWDALIEACKVNPGVAFGLTALQNIRDGVKNMEPKDRIQLAKGLKDVTLVELVSAVRVEMRCTDAEGMAVAEVLAKMLSGYVAYGQLIEGIEPTFVELLAAVSRVETLHEEMLHLFRVELVRRRGEKEPASQALPYEVDGDVSREPARERASDHQAFEREYLKALKQDYGYMELLGIPSYTQAQPIDAGFVSLTLEGAGGRGLPAESVLREHPRLVIVGDAGAGKTTLMKWEAVRYCDGIRKELGRDLVCAEDRQRHKDIKEDEQQIVPFFIRLRSLVEEGRPGLPTPDRWVKMSTQWLTTPEPSGWLDSVLREGRGLLILDGLDELPPKRRPGFWRTLADCLEHHPGLRFRVTSRPFPHDDEKGNQWQVPETVPEVKVLELSRERIGSLIDRWHEAAVAEKETEEGRERVRRELVGYPAKLKKRLQQPEYAKLRELASTPFFCAAICLINRYRRQLLPEKRQELYRMLVDALLELRDRERGIVTQTVYDEIENDVWFRLHAKLALAMMTSGMKKADDGAYLIEVERADAIGWITDYIETFSVLRGRTDADELLGYMVTRCGLLREPVKGKLDFRHRALQEYLAGSAAMIYDRIGQLVSESHNDQWRDTIVLAAGGYNVADPQATRLIRDLIDRGKREKLNICFAIAVACLETAGARANAKTQDLALEKLEKLLPPRNSEDAKVLSAAGDRVVEYVPYEKTNGLGTGVLIASAETLRRVGSDKAAAELRKGYVNNENENVLEQVVQCPGINPLEIPAIVPGEAKKVAIPRYARPHLKDLVPLKERQGIEELDVSDCPELADIKRICVLSDLRKLDLGRCQTITDLSALADLRNLEKLSLRCCDKVTDLAVLAGLKNLTTLDLANCRSVRDLSSLESLRNLGSLDLQGIPDAVWPASLLDSLSKAKAGKDYLETVDGINMQMVWVPEGSFKMGGKTYDREKPEHEVQLEGFWLAKYPVTQEQYEAIMGKNPSEFKGENNPVECVTWNDAVEFCRTLSEKGGKRFCLPGEAQWEYACRAESTGEYCFGNSVEELEDYAWYDANAGDGTHPVGEKRGNAWGLYDMHGNVWEWIKDDYHENYKGAPTDGSAWVDVPRGEYRVLRGGGWYDRSDNCRSAYRYRNRPSYSDDFIGFRLARTP